MERTSLRLTVLVTGLTLLLSILSRGTLASESLSNYRDHQRRDRSIIFTTTSGQRLRVTPYGEYIIRIQTVRNGEEFFPDDRYEMVEPRAWGGSLRLIDEGPAFLLSPASGTGTSLRIRKIPLRLMFLGNERRDTLLNETTGVWWHGDTIGETFAFNSGEHFTGLGHGFFGRSESLDLTGHIEQRNYGSAHGQQAPLIVPFYLSSKGYGIFLNCTFPNSFTFGKDGVYEFSISSEGRMDYFYIAGPGFPQIIDRYTQLTGRPRLPPRAIFGLALSDKGNDHTSASPSDEAWWKAKVVELRKAGFAIDHLVNDNRWRAGGGKRCESYFEWDATRFPDPAEYERWVKANGLVVTIDFNRCIAKQSDGWKATYNIPEADSIEFGDSAPDLTRKDVRDWFWGLFWRKSLAPDLHYPGDALWIDEFDELGKAPLSMTLGNGRTWREMKNYWFFLIAKALVADGWDRGIGPAKRPFVWVRGMTAGAQRYATLWSGDIRSTYSDMKTQVRGMQLAGLSGFPFWGHDAGGFFDWDVGKGPDDAMYRQWSMAWGSFTPYWKPHGMGQSRWPLDRSPQAQRDAMKYDRLRYQLIPYIYSCAHEASTTGMPMARAMVIDYQYEHLAWTHDLQYMWGKEMLVAPNCSDSGSVSVWLPAGTWYDFWNDSTYRGNQVVDYPAPIGKLPLFVRAGSIVPMAPPAPGTAFVPNDTLIVHVYVGADGRFRLYEDDGISEAFRMRGELRTTDIAYTQSEMRVSVGAAAGTYSGAPTQRAYRIVFHALHRPMCIAVQGTKVDFARSESEALTVGIRALWKPQSNLLVVFLGSRPVTQEITVGVVQDCTPSAP